jgi:rubrerythrin
MDQQLDLIMGAKKSLEATLIAERKHRQELEEKLQTLKAKPIKSNKLTSETVSQEEK